LRFEDWPRRLERFLVEACGREFHYGAWDCSLFVADAVQAMTGTDIAAPFRGRYASYRDALQLARSESPRKSLRSFLAQALTKSGLSEIAVPFAQRGDVLLLKRSRDCSLGILSLNGKDILAAAETGYTRLPFHLALRAWRV
jgi:hypothetical protein